MKKALLGAFAALFAVLGLVENAQARDGFYLTARGGMTWNNLNSKDDAISDDKVTKLDHVGVYSGAIGYKYKYFRGEFEYVWRADAEEDITTDSTMGSLPTGSMEVKSESYMFNAYLDFLPNYWISPYLSAGIGMSKLELTNETFSEDPEFAQSETWEKDTFTWQVGAGLTLRLNRCLNIDAGYRYYTLGKIENAEINTHEWYAGIRFTF